MNLFCRTLLLLIVSLCGGRALAACGLPASTASFGTLTSFTLNSSTATTSGQANVNCGSGSVLSLLANNRIILSLSGASSTRGNRATLTRSGGDSGDVIPLQLCTDAACSNELFVGSGSRTYNNVQLLDLIGLLGGLNFTMTLTLRTVPGAVVSAGTYSGILNVNADYRICTGISLIGLCLLGAERSGSGLIPLTVTLNVSNDCTTIVAPNVSFGSAPLVSRFNSVTQSINVICTKGSSYSVGLSNGNHAVNGARNMANGSALMRYEIYKAASNDRWGPTGSERWPSVSASGVSSDGLTRTYNYTARVLTSQSTPAAGDYSDSVVVDLAF
ncbi:spore coat U domain-containing protein [Pantoea sp. 1.19]|uniref:Csu type fimbrial protein n=1 Tax=Pantoea sp. 1.19 TaxID=1925589 RepID=UPI00094911AC|nr:spore coat U domain-containing protein [Pantoea sp. 1.19]